MNIKAVPFFIDRLINVYFSNFRKRTNCLQEQMGTDVKSGKRRALDPRTRWNMSTNFVHERCGTLFSSTSSKTTSFALFTVFFFYMVSRLCDDRNNAVYSYDTLDEEDVLITF